jgi:hypothetical protein
MHERRFGATIASMFEAPDREAEALKDLGRRVSRARSWVAGLSVSAGLAIGVAAYIKLRQLQLDLVGVHRPYITGAVTVGVAFAMSGLAAKWIGRLVVRLRSPAWIEAVRTRYEVAPDPLREFLGMWD